MTMHNLSDALNSEIFVTTLTGQAQEWFTNLPTGCIADYIQFMRKFDYHFASKQKDRLMRKKINLMITALKMRPFADALIRDRPSDMEELMMIAHKYIYAEEMNEIKSEERRVQKQLKGKAQEKIKVQEMIAWTNMAD
ncbi:hypothetical protein BUALT_Bualt03G0186500 [Buddleja alternifolia]|uniref:Retrotransposon gag domain-containing protein n=1 Tax=Buddleja alternifolia TaxID=168488 RepID=A0AAV6Y5T4_9LAMI|nr:hypothetical protein BUALT_Bualt03G0186500 [Buddleja alternifolia]